MILQKGGFAILLYRSIAIIVLSVDNPALGGRMTPIGSNLVTELVSEINQKIEDDKLLLAKRQGLNYLKATLRGLILIPQAICYAALVLAVFTLATADSEFIALLSSFSNHDWLDFLSSLKILVCYVAAAVGFIMAFRMVRDVKEERQRNDQAKVDQVQDTVDIIEEVLIRHNLISVKEIENVQKID